MAERYRKHVYCEKNFLEHCIKTIAGWKFCEQNFEELSLWMCIKSLIFSPDIVLHLDISDDDLPQFNGPKSQKVFSAWAIELAQMQSEQNIHLKLGDFVTPETINKSDNKQLTAYYLTCCDCETCQKCMDECGVLAICPENIKNFKSILYDNGSAIGKNEQTDWKQKLIFTPCNSLVLVDNYILSDSKGVENLKKIFDILLPKSLDTDIPFQISIFTTLKKGNAKNDIDSQDCLKKIAILVEQLRPELYFKLAIFKCSFEKFHDRIIITNNTYISCGGGFDLMKDGKSEKSTTLNYVFPFFYKTAKWDSMAYSNFLNGVKDNYDKATEFKADYLTGFFVGSKTNRLITQC